MSKKEHKGLPSTAYEAIPGDQYEPYIPNSQKMDESTPLAIILGVVIGIIFAMAMVYVGLKVGMTISASIPAAVISMGVMKGIFRKGTILENNLAKAIASAGEAMAAGAIFTIPAAFLWPEYSTQIAPEYSIWRLTLIAAIGGILGVLMMIPLRRFLIVQEHGNLKFPEGTACAEVLVAGEVGGNPAKVVFTAMGVGGLYTFLQQAVGLWQETISFDLSGKVMKNLVFSADCTPILLGVGYIIGLEVSAYMLAGGLLSWFVLIPLISYYGAHMATNVAPATVLISQMDADAVWSNYIRYIGAGSVAMGGVISLGKAMPTIISSFKVSIKELINDFTHKSKGTEAPKKDRIHDDLPMSWVLIISVVLVALIAVVTGQMAKTGTLGGDVKLGIITALLVFIFSFFFVTVASRLVGLVGSSSNPVSGMTIGTLILCTVIFKALGYTGIQGMVISLMVGTFVCFAICLSGDISQDLKTSFLLGGTSRWMQIGDIIGVVGSTFFVIWVLMKLQPDIVNNNLAAPQANLMALIIKGIMQANLPWELVIAGAFISVCIEVLGIPALPVAVGLYLPLSLSTPVIIGGGLSWLTSKKFKGEEYKTKNENGILASSGLIAGNAIMGLITLITLAATEKTIFEMITGAKAGFANYWWISAGAFLLVTWYLWKNVVSADGAGGDNGKGGIKEIAGNEGYKEIINE